MRIGDILVRAGMVSDEDLAAALAKQKLDKKTPLGQMLKLLNYLKEEDLDLVLQAQRKILFASMSGDLAIAAIKYARVNNLNFQQATEKVLVTLRGGQSLSSQLNSQSGGPIAAAVSSSPAADGAVKTGAARFVGNPIDLLHKSDKAAALQDWEPAIELLEQARTMYERSDAFGDEASIPVYCRLAAIYSKTNRNELALQNIAKVALKVKSGIKLSPGSVTLLAAAANLSSRQEMTEQADNIYQQVLPKWTDLLPFESAQFNVCLRDAIACSRKLRTCARKNIRIGELLVDSKLLTADQFQEAFQKSKRIRQPLGRVMSDLGLLSTQDLRNAVRVQLMCRAAVLPSEYAAATVKAASIGNQSPDAFFEKLNVPLDAVASNNTPGSLAELVSKMDQLILLEETKGVKDVEVALMTDELGDICLKRGELEDAEAMYRRSHAVFAVAGERYQINLGSICQKIGKMLIQQKKYPEAELLLLQSMEIKNRLLGDKHKEVAEVLVDVGYLYFCQANYFPAIGFLRSSWMIQQDDSSREQKRFLLELLIKCFEQSGQDAESDVYREQLREIRAAE